MIQTDLSECFLKLLVKYLLASFNTSLGVGAGILLKQRMMVLELT